LAYSARWPPREPSWPSVGRSSGAGAGVEIAKGTNISPSSATFLLNRVLDTLGGAGPFFMAFVALDVRFFPCFRVSVSIL
jgi:hypothetical protein